MSDNNLKVGDKLEICSYKHNKKIHKIWEEAIVLDIKDDYMVFGNNKTTVIESDGSSWKTREPAITYFYKDKWYNVICQFKEKGVFYYCNIASPFVIENNVIKYIDYDLDLRVFPDGIFRILDRDEYKYHKKIMHYSKEIDLIVDEELSSLIEKYKTHGIPFDIKTNQYYYSIYNEYTKKV